MTVLIENHTPPGEASSEANEGMGDYDIGERLKLLLGKHGEGLVQGISDELELLHRELAALKGEVAALGDYQSSRGLFLEPPAPAATPSLPQRATIEADQMLRPHDGFYGIEHAADGTPFRWTGPSVQFCFNVFVDRRGGADVRLQALTSIDFEIQKRMTLIVDGQTMPVGIEPDGAGFAVSAYLPPREDQGASGLVFILPAVLMPPGGAETRVLGIAFARLTVTARQAAAMEMDRIPDSIAAQ